MVISDEIDDSLNDPFVYAVLISSKNHYPQFTIEITPEMTSIPLLKKSYFVTHQIDKIPLSRIVQKRGFVKSEYQDLVMAKIIRTIFDYEIEIQ